MGVDHVALANKMQQIGAAIYLARRHPSDTNLAELANALVRINSQMIARQERILLSDARRSDNHQAERMKLLEEIDELADEGVKLAQRIEATAGPNVS